jgi:hypothetical protein
MPTVLVPAPALNDPLAVMVSGLKTVLPDNVYPDPLRVTLATLNPTTSWLTVRLVGPDGKITTLFAAGAVAGFQFVAVVQFESVVPVHVCA